MSDSAEALYLAESGALLQQYREVVKPLLALVEAEYERFPIPVYNEVRSFVDHLSRCYDANGIVCDEDLVRDQLVKASHHIKRTIYDLYKLLIICGKEEVERFERKTRMLDLRTVDSDGSFSSCYEEGRQCAVMLTRQAKGIEATGDTLATYEAYDRAYQAYLDLHHLIEDNDSSLHKAKVKWFAGKVLSPVLFVVGVIVSPYIESAWNALLALFL